jgi:hypothetical protein
VNDTPDMQDWTEPDDDLVPPPPEPPRRRRRFRPLVWAVEIAGTVLGGLLLILALLAFRLGFGPVEVNFLTPMLVAYLNAKADPLTVQIDGTSLSSTAGRSTIDLVGSGMRVYDPAGNEVISIPKLSVSLNLRALVSGRLAASRVAVIGPRLKLVRAKTGEIGVDLGMGTPSAESEPALAEAPPSLQEVWDAFSGAPSQDRSLSYLDLISVLRADIALDDRQSGLVWHVGDAEVDFTRRRDGFDADLATGLGLGEVETHVLGHARYTREGKHLDFSFGWAPVDLSRLGPILPAPYDGTAAALRLPIAGQAQGALGLGDFQLGALHLQLDAGSGALVDPFFAGGRLDVSGITLTADYAPAAQQLKLTRFLLDLGGPSIDLSASVSHVPADARALLSGTLPAPLAVSSAAALRAMPIDRLAAYWPPTMASHTRSWITTNMAAGTIDELRFTANFALDPAGAKPIDAADFSGSMVVKGTSVDYLHGLPRVEGIDATITIQPKRLEFNLASGHVKGLNLSQGTIVMDEFDAPVERATIDLALAGPAQDVMTVLDTKPLQYARALGIDPHQVAGAVDGTLHFRFPLKAQLQLTEIEYAASAKLSGLNVGHAALGRDLTEGNFALTLDKAAVVLDGTAKLDGLAGTVTWKQRLSGSTGPKGEAHVKTVFDEAARKRFNLDLLADYLHGPIGADLVYSEFDDHRSHAAVTLDLAASELEMADLGWRKPAAQPAHGELSVEFADGQVTRITDLSLRGPRLEIKGDLGFGADGRLTEAHLPKFRVGETDTALTLGRKGDAWLLGLRGPVVDLAEPLKRVKYQRAAKPDGAGPMVLLDVQSEQLVLGPERVLRNAQLTATIADRSLAEGTLAAAIGRSGKVDFKLGPIESGGAFSLATDDFGALLHVAAVSDDVVGGKLTLTGHAVREAKGRHFSGRVEGSDYRFVGAPFMVRLLSIASLSSIQTMLNGDGIPFTTLKADLSLYDGKLELSHARAYGGALGVNVDGGFDLDANTLHLDGTLVPAYTLNSALGDVPVLGDLLVGGEGQGVFAANFGLGGQIDTPTITVNPLSPLAPGFLRRLFLFDAPDPASDNKPAKGSGK